MTKAAPSVSRSPSSVRSSPCCAVDRTHQREIEQDGDAGCRQHADERGEKRRTAVLHDDRGDDRREHDDLAVREIEDAAESVDQRHPDAEQPERQPEHDPVENDSRHATPRYARRTSGLRSSSSEAPLSRIRPFSST